MKCKKCTNVRRDPSTGYLICITCGSVLEDSTIEQGIEFDDNQKATGTFIDNTKGNLYSSTFQSNFSHMIDPIQIRLNKVYKYIIQVATILNIPTSVIERAKKLYNVASNRKFTQGRKTKQIVGAILYLACRWDSTKHLLIDFSEALQINLFVIGATYLKLVKLLGMQIKIIDPSLFMHRFCNKFNFGNNTKNIEDTALKILQFLKRDWITTGRRPSGLCGACILISAKLHGFNLTIEQVADVVHVCNDTIKKRIEEFSLTKVAGMTKEEFEKFQNTQFYFGMDPPAFIKTKDTDIEDIKKTPTEEVFFKPVNVPKPKSVVSETEILSNLDESDANKYLYDDNEYLVRKQIWDIMYKNWINEQEDKKAAQKNIRKISSVSKRRKISVAISQDGSKPNPYEAIKNCGKFFRSYFCYF